MLGNLINIDDFVEFWRKIRRRKHFADIALANKARTAKHWSAGTSGTHWWDIPAVRERWNLMITGSPETDFRKFIAEKHLKTLTGAKVLSIGCGDGTKEIEWAKHLDIARLDGVDLSPERVDRARKNAEKANLGTKFFFTAEDFWSAKFNSDYDIVLAEQILHHLSPIDKAVAKISSALKPGGILIANEYIGPDRFQWTPRQCAIINGLLTIIPEQFRIIEGTSTVKKKVYRPGKLAMWINDPSEAAESSRIISAIKKFFKIEAEYGYGGCVIHPLLRGIAHNFIPETPLSRKVLDLCFAVEDLALESKELSHDFAVIVARKT